MIFQPRFRLLFPAILIQTAERRGYFKGCTYFVRLDKYILVQQITRMLFVVELIILMNYFFDHLQISVIPQAQPIRTAGQMREW